MSDEDRSWGIPHPRLTMDDITEVSGQQEIEKQNTISLDKNIEVSFKQFFSVIIGLGIGFVVFLCTYQIIGLYAAAFLLVLITAACPFLFVSKVRDATDQTKWVRLLNKVKSKDIEGKAFFPNSDTPENITHLETMILIRK